MAESGAMLDYVPRGRHARRRWWWWAAAGGVLITVALALPSRDLIVEHARTLYWQQRCMTYARPPGTPVVTAETVLETDRDYRQTTWGRGGASLLPECWRMFVRQTLRQRTPPWVSGTGNVPPTVFLHERVSPSGNRRLVRIESIYANALRPQVGYVVTVIVPGSPWRPPNDVGPRFAHSYSGRFIQADLFFGQPDPDDASHFTIDFAVEGKVLGTVDGWLRDDETVLFKLRDPASTRGL